MTKLFLILSLLFTLSMPFENVAHANNVIYGAPISRSVSATPSQVFAKNSLRAYLLLVNVGSNPIYVAFDSSASVGIPIPPGGNYEPNGDAPANAIFVFTASSTSNVVATQGQ